MKVCIITGSRADWSGLGMVARELRADGHTVAVIATGQHIPLRLADIEADAGKPRIVDLKVNGGTPLEVAGQAGVAVAEVARALHAIGPDLVILAGDRYEIVSAALAAAVMGIEIAHIAGGDRTEGSQDDAYRDAITGLATYHLTTSMRAAVRVSMMARNPDRVFLTGSPAIDRIVTTSLMTRKAVFASIGHGLKPGKLNVLVAYHPEKYEHPYPAELSEMLNALRRLPGDVRFIVLGVNADPGGATVELLLKRFVAENLKVEPSVYLPNVPSLLYLSLLKHCDLMIGNSSAGLYEAPSFGIPVVNIGYRQAGREMAANVRHAEPSERAILQAIHDALAAGRKVTVNPYGDGTAARKIADIFKPGE